IVVDQRLERDAERPAIREDPLMMVGDPARTRIEVHVVAAVPGDRLTAARLLDEIAAADRPVAPARAAARLEHADRVAGLAELERRHHAGDAGADDHYADPGARARRQLGRSGI